MAADGLFPGDLAIVVSLLDAALDDTLTVPKSIRAHLSFDSGGDPSEFPAIIVAAPAFDLFYSYFSKVGLHRLIDLINLVHFVLFQWGACVPVLAAPTFTFQQVAHELLFHYKIAYQDIIDCYQEFLF